jgi:hypothetical protein
MLMGLDKGGVMKGYLFGLGAMLVGAGLMFVLMHGEVSAADYNKIKCEFFESTSSSPTPKYFHYCKVKDLTCVLTGSGVSCVPATMNY